jgi:phage host-nuclease inhibitor protein Gam
MRRTDLYQRGRELSEEAITGIKEWRLQHPRASLKEIEAAIDERLAKVRARMLQDAALASDQTDWTEAPALPDV